MIRSGLISGLRRIGIAPAILVVLLSIRVATAAAVECQHSLAEAARLAAQAQQSLRLEAAARGDALCLTEDTQQTTRSGGSRVAAGGETGPHLNTPCPFFNSPVLDHCCAIGPAVRPVTFTQVVARPLDLWIAAGNLPAAYSSRAPPLRALG